MHIGTDIIRVKRFKTWLSYAPEPRLTIFSPHEESELWRRTPQSAQLQYLASRWAAKEACYKAICSALLVTATKPFSFRAIARFISVVSNQTWGVPELVIDYAGFALSTGISLPPLTTSLSLSHETDMAIAVVLCSIT